MMHHKDVVVCITDNKEKTYREYDFNAKTGFPFVKSSTVILPFDSEYKIFVKNTNKNHRILISIDIDGTNVTDSGVVINANSSGHIERFINIPKKFKFVPSNSNGVADPTSPDNGNLTITIHRECVEAYIPPTIPTGFRNTLSADDDTLGFDDSMGRGRGRQGRRTEYKSNTANYSCDSIPTKGSSDQVATGSCMYFSEPMYDKGGDRGIEISANSGGEAGNMLADMQALRDANLSAESLGEVGATVEGNHSNQSFTTTDWKGNEDLYGFQFQFSLRGRSETQGMSAHEAAEFEEYKRLQKKFAAK